MVILGTGMLSLKRLLEDDAYPCQVYTNKSNKIDLCKIQNDGVDVIHENINLCSSSGSVLLITIGGYLISFVFLRLGTIFLYIYFIYIKNPNQTRIL